MHAAEICDQRCGTITRYASNINVIANALRVEHAPKYTLFPITLGAMAAFFEARIRSGICRSLRTYASAALYANSIIMAARTALQARRLWPDVACEAIVPWGVNDAPLGALNKRGNDVGQRDAATQPLLPEQVSEWLQLESTNTGTDWSQSSLAAALFVGLAAGLRGGEVSALQRSHIKCVTQRIGTAAPRRAFVVDLKGRKTHDTARHEPTRTVAQHDINPHGPFATIETWLVQRDALVASSPTSFRQIATAKDGLVRDINSLFFAVGAKRGQFSPISSSGMRAAFQQVALDLKLENANHYGAKSVRVGTATSLAASGAGSEAIGAIGGWNSAKSIKHYLDGTIAISSGWLDTIATPGAPTATAAIAALVAPSAPAATRVQTAAASQSVATTPTTATLARSTRTRNSIVRPARLL